MKFAKGKWRVTRNCCTSGNCGYCMGITPVGQARRLVQAEGYSMAYATWVAANWSGYKAMAEPMTGAPRTRA